MGNPLLIISEPHIVMPKDRPLLGLILREADLISAEQLQIALADKQVYSEYKLGEILALRGWLKHETADFFAQEWFSLQEKPRTHPLGYYLEEAALLNEQQLQQILREQKRMGLRLGEMAVLNGYLKQKTIDFFLKHLQTKTPLLNANSTENTQKEKKSPVAIKFAGKTSIQTNGNTSHNTESTQPEIDPEDIPWI